LELNTNNDGFKPFSGRAYPIPHLHYETTKKEINRLVRIGILREVVMDFQQLNKMLKQKPYPISNIPDLLQSLNGLKYATAIDLSMGYYHISLCLRSQEYCTIVLPWGKFRYFRLPVGVASSADIFQNVMNNIFADMPEVRAYIDDILIARKSSYEHHLEVLSKILTRLQKKGFKINLRKSFFAVDQFEYLEFWQPQKRKVDAILKILPPRRQKTSMVILRDD
jgi:Reverse transcriptase (RNA-dependent DNA polymerase)